MRLRVRAGRGGGGGRERGRGRGEGGGGGAGGRGAGVGVRGVWGRGWGGGGVVVSLGPAVRLCSLHFASEARVLPAARFARRLRWMLPWAPRLEEVGYRHGCGQSRFGIP